jgi:hypothetical protein
MVPCLAGTEREASKLSWQVESPAVESPALPVQALVSHNLGSRKKAAMDFSQTLFFWFQKNFNVN